MSVPSAAWKRSRATRRPTYCYRFRGMLSIEKVAFRRAAFLWQDNLDASQLRLVGQHPYQPGMWNGDELLVVDPPDIDLLLPVGIVADHQGAGAMVYELLDHPAAGNVAQMFDLAVAFTRQAPTGHFFPRIVSGELYEVLIYTKYSTLSKRLRKK
jgi:hypothetical protein